MTEASYANSDESQVKPGPWPWTVEKTVTTPEKHAILTLCTAVEILTNMLTEGGDDSRRAGRLQEIGALLAQARELAKPDTAVIYDPSHPDAAAPSKYPLRQLAGDVSCSVSISYDHEL